MSGPALGTAGLTREGDALAFHGPMRHVAADLVKAWCRAKGMKWRLATVDDDVRITFGRDGEIEATLAHFGAWLAGRRFRTRQTGIGDATLCSLMVEGPGGETDLSSLLDDPLTIAN